MRRPRVIAILVTIIWCSATVSRAQQPPAAPTQGDAEDLARKLANPISDLVSVPFQFNWEQNVGPNEATRFILNVQPVMPFAMNKDWNLITRVIVPFVSQPALVNGGSPASGVSDVLASFFFSPSRPGLIWGVGPAISLPSTSFATLGTEKWSAGPTVVVLKQTGKMTYGALWNQVWSFSGNTQRADVNQMFLQPLFAYQATRTLTVTLQSETTANWEVEEDRWTVPKLDLCKAVVVRRVPRELPARCRWLCGTSRGRTVLESPGRHRRPAAAAAVAFGVAMV